MYDVGQLFYLFRENKGTDQLHGKHIAELRLCFHMYEGMK